mgnify:CR=1 FL=1
MNTKLLREVEKEILAEPRRLRMDSWVERVYGKGETMPPCGTTACIAGFATILHKGMPDYVNKDFKARAWYLLDYAPVNYEGYAMDALQLGSEQAERLFYVSSWPEKFLAAWEQASTPLRRAEVAVARIEHFIKTKGKE